MVRKMRPIQNCREITLTRSACIYCRSAAHNGSDMLWQIAILPSPLFRHGHYSPHTLIHDLLWPNQMIALLRKISLINQGDKSHNVAQIAVFFACLCKRSSQGSLSPFVESNPAARSGLNLPPTFYAQIIKGGVHGKQRKKERHE